MFCGQGGERGRPCGWTAADDAPNVEYNGTMRGEGPAMRVDGGRGGASPAGSRPACAGPASAPRFAAGRASGAPWCLPLARMRAPANEY